jgi:hypothetical protein
MGRKVTVASIARKAAKKAIYKPKKLRTKARSK